MSNSHPSHLMRRRLEELEDDCWDGPGQTTGLVRRCHSLRRVPIGQLDSAGLRVLIRQEIGLLRLVPLALDHLRDEPMLKADYYPGDLLVALLRVSPTFWERQAGMRKQLVKILGQPRLDEVIRPEKETDPMLPSLVEAFVGQSN